MRVSWVVERGDPFRASGRERFIARQIPRNSGLFGRFKSSFQAYLSFWKEVKVVD